MSGNAAGDRLLVVKTRHVSRADSMATSPPLGSIQWNLRFIDLDPSGARIEATEDEGRAADGPESGIAAEPPGSGDRPHT
jgi:hypothetical protein